MKKKALLILLALLLAISLVAFSCPSPQTTTPPTTTPPTTTPPTTTPTTVKPIVLTFACELVEFDSRSMNIYKPWFADIEEATEGRVTVQAYWADTLCAAPESYGAVVTGLADMAHIGQIYTPGQFPMSDVMVLSSLDKNVWRPSRVFNELYQKFPEMQAEYADVKVLCLNTPHPVAIATTKKPVRTLEDNQGLKMWVAGRLPTMEGEAVGWAPLSILPVDMYSSLEKGVADGGTVMLDWLWAMKLGELVKYVNVTPFWRMPLFIGMNLERWNSLPADIQQAIDDVSGLSLADRIDREEGLAWQRGLAQATDEFGIEVIELSQEELARWVDVVKPVNEVAIAELEGMGLPGRELFEEYWQLEEKYSAPEWEIEP